MVHRVGSNGTVTVSAISRIPYLCYCAFCRSSLNELCWWYCILQVVIQMRLVFPGVMPKWTPIVMSSFLNFVHETICYFNWMNKNKKLISIDVLKYSHLYIYIYPFIRDRGQIDRYRKHCTNTVCLDLSGVGKYRPLHERKNLLSHSRSFKVIRDYTDE